MNVLQYKAADPFNFALYTCTYTCQESEMIDQESNWKVKEAFYMKEIANTLNNDFYRGHDITIQESRNYQPFQISNYTNMYLFMSNMAMLDINKYMMIVLPYPK